MHIAHTLTNVQHFFMYYPNFLRSYKKSSKKPGGLKIREKETGFPLAFMRLILPVLYDIKIYMITFPRARWTAFKMGGSISGQHLPGTGA